MKVISFTALHYGKTFLADAIRSVIDRVDEHHIIYSDIGSHGFQTDRTCPDTRAELYAIAQQAAGDKLHWYEGRFQHEGYQRDKIFELAPDADIILVVDSDEVYADGLAQGAIEQASRMTHRTIRLPFIHYYRSFHRAIRYDPAYPVRVICPKVESGELSMAIMRNDNEFLRINHFGYAQDSATIRYKLSIHGHSNELRCSPDDYVDGIYLDADRWTDLHVVGSEYWNAEPVQPLDFMPTFMSDHKYFDTEIIA